ncbi:MAG: hypothetical protein V7735_16645 [Photobacterium frigidiphilum]|uniref:hypothetical protein n=1 Tax=Photobacterium frigidiphilum TaxID=264736 RepID=UPI003002B702
MNPDSYQEWLDDNISNLSCWQALRAIRESPKFRTLSPSGRISASDINSELGRPATQRLSLNDSEARSLAGKPSGRIAYSDLHGKTFKPYIGQTVYQTVGTFTHTLNAKTKYVEIIGIGGGGSVSIYDTFNGGKGAGGYILIKEYKVKP